MRSLAFVAAFLALGACQRERVREHDGILPGTRPGRVAVFLVRDARTGRPVEGAVVRQHLEWAMGRDGRWAPAVAEARTDEFGLAAFAVGEETGDCHWAVHAAGFAPTEEYGEDIEAEVDLVPGTRCAGRLLDIDGRPLADATLEWKTGCAHAPALATARTDRHGLFAFEDVDVVGDAVFVGGQGVPEYVSTAPAAAPWRIPTFQILPGRTIEGRVVRGDGMPPPWAVVTTIVGRGPCATAAPDGSFSLPGVGGSGLHVWWDGGLAEALEDYAPGLPVVLRVEQEEEPARVPVRVRVRGAQDAPPGESVEVHFDRMADGQRLSVEWSSWGEGVAEVSLAAGDYLVSAGHPWSPKIAARRELALEGPLDLEVEVRPQPTLLIRPPNIAGSYEATWRVVLEDTSWEVDPAGDEPIHLPADARAWLRIDLDGVPYTCAIGPAEDGVRSADVRLPGVKFIETPGHDDGVEAELLSAVGKPVGSGLATFAVGEHWLRLSHPERGWALVPLSLPWQAADVQPRAAWQPWPPLAELRVLDVDGRPAPGVAVEGLDLPADPSRPWPGERQEESDETGIFRARWLRDGTYVRVTAEGCVPFWKQLAGDPPYEVRLGTATIEVDLSEFTEGACLLDGWPVEADHTGHVTLRGVTSGTHTLLAGASGRRTLVHRLVLREGETRRLKPRLPRR